MLVYIASPYSQGDQEQNVKESLSVGDLVFRSGHLPVCPLLSHYWNQVKPRSYEQWMKLDLALVSRCDALIRIPGKSPGADREVAHAKRCGIPVYSLASWMEQHAPDIIKRDATWNFEVEP